MKMLDWRSRLILRLLRWMQRKESTILVANFAWNSPPDLGEPKMVLQVHLHGSEIILTRIWMRPADARMFCQGGLEEIDKQLAQWQEYWRKDSERE